jgi:hypothetical protein
MTIREVGRGGVERGVGKSGEVDGVLACHPNIPPGSRCRRACIADHKGPNLSSTGNVQGNQMTEKILEEKFLKLFMPAQLDARQKP